MNTLATRQCPECKAIANIHWSICLACHSSLSPEPVVAVMPLAANQGTVQASSEGMSRVDGPIVLDPAATIQPGNTLTWLRGGKPQEGKVDFFHVDDTGTLWAFVNLPEGQWAAVNMKFATVLNTSISDEQGPL